MFMPTPNSILDVSIILPALMANADYLRCIYSIRAALGGAVNYEIISIVPDLSKFRELDFSDLSFILEDGPGIYRAMNLGLERAIGKYVYFIGQDDILLPDAALAISQGTKEDADVILANVFWGHERIHKNYGLRHSLVWTNWCHQGAFYNRLTFSRVVKSFPLEYKAQADHYSNIALGADRSIKIVRYDRCVDWYSATGFSTQSPDLVFRSAFPGIVRKHFGLVSYSAIVGMRILSKCIRSIWKPK
jgi:glycosyltransferase involved in cell wall biosynthesis